MLSLVMVTRMGVIAYLVLLVGLGVLFLPGQFSAAHPDPDRGANTFILILGGIIAAPNLLATFKKTRSFMPIALALDAVAAAIFVVNIPLASRTGPSLSAKDIAIDLALVFGHLAAALSLLILHLRRARPVIENVFE